MSLRLKVWLSALVLGLMGLQTVVGFFLSRPIPAHLHQQFTRQLIAIGLLDSYWNKSLIELELYLQKNYDQSQTFAATIEQALHDMSPLLNQLPKASQADLGAALATLEGRYLQKKAAADYFIASHSARSYLSQSFLQNNFLRSEIIKLPNALRLPLQNLWAQNIQRYVFQQDAVKILEAVDSQLVKNLLAHWPNPKQAAIAQEMILILERFLEQETRSTQALRDFIDNGFLQELQNFEKVYTVYYQQRLRQDLHYRSLALPLLLLLGAWLIYAAWQLQHSYRQLARSKALLQKSNQRLNARVARRTKSLEQALLALKHSQSQLLHAEKMASLGQLMAGIAHEINTPLGFSRSNLSLVLEQWREAASDDPLLAQDLREEQQQLLQSSLNGLNRLQELVKSLKNFSRLDRQALSVFDLNESLESTLQIIQYRLRHGIVVEKQLATLPLLRGFASEIHQVLLNILVNALDAIEEKSQMTTAENPQNVQNSQNFKAEAYVGKIALKTWQDAAAIYLSISDNAQGIDLTLQEKVFEPFFTTKPIGKGVGLGLAISYAIMQKHQGRLWVTSQPGAGATFYLALPLTMLA